ncbi:fatty acid cis/trans isomerase [Vibrio maerlii]|uniref:fatty acid cis/trans isomerase n=1 Tax=Vibrio maerlii TaxID=2231648 RepID=UPI000E3B72A8|nr:fatty acid cis/trans isomerase [Vibrio maerlii]
MKLNRLFTIALAILFSGCATYAGLNYDQLFGEPEVRNRVVEHNSTAGQDFLAEVKPILDNRCVVCHACYDAPCQLKLSSVDGIERGSSKELVYQGTRLTAAQPTRLFEDALTTQEWRELGFHPVLNERDQNVTANLEAGVMAKMLAQKELYPQPQQDQLEGFDFAVDRTQVCPTVEEFDKYQQQHPTWGMPYGLPNLDPEEYATLKTWLAEGAQMSPPVPLSPEEMEQVETWEHFFNKGSRKVQLTSRYVYEHIYLFNLYFSDLNLKPGQSPRFFSLIRSSTPPGEPVQRIVTRRPYDDPQVDRVYYRLVSVPGTIVDKTHMPYTLNSTKLIEWTEWFLADDYDVPELPSYDVDIAANPMTAFDALPVNARFKFLLQDAQNTIQAFIKGPVCRGQLALNVINDRFWVFFVDPDKADLPEVNEFYDSQRDNLKLPGELDSNTLPVLNWVKYSKQQARYLKAKSEFTNKWFKDGEHLTTDIIWDGNGSNDTAALTVFRHFDSASVVKGLVGEQPKTAWVIDYALLERIHYLLVAGFDVYGNFGHQLITRLYMDFLRLEGESHFLTLLPEDMRHEEHQSWYIDKPKELNDFLQSNVQPFSQPTGEQYLTDDPKAELFTKLKEKLAPVLDDRYEITNTTLANNNEEMLAKIDKIDSDGIQFFPQLITIVVDSEEGQPELFTLIHNNAHKNISSLFSEDNNRIPEDDDLTLVRGVVGSYPAALLRLNENEIEKFVSLVSTVSSEADYVKLLDQFAIRRSSSEFWPTSDLIHQVYQVQQPIEAGLLDYNRLENR